MTTATEPTGLNAIEALQSVYAEAKAWVEAHPTLDIKPYNASLWQGYVPEDEDAMQVTADLIVGARPGTVTRTQRGSTVNLKRTFGVNPLTIDILLHVRTPAEEEIVTILNPATDDEGSEVAAA